LDFLFPGLDHLGVAEPGRTKQPTEITQELVTLNLERPDMVVSSEWSDLLVLIEVLAGQGAEFPWDDFAQSFMVDLSECPFTRGTADYQIPRGR
jgi:hypothetical protein